MADRESFGAVLGVDADEDAGLFCGDESESVLNKGAMRAVVGLTTGEEVGERFFRHGQVGAIVDAGDGLTVLTAAHSAKELDLGSLFGLEVGGGREDRIGGETEGHEMEGRMKMAPSRRSLQMGLCFALVPVICGGIGSTDDEPRLDDEVAGNGRFWRDVECLVCGVP